MANEDVVIQRIRKLLAVAKDAKDKNEALAAAKVAAELAQKHRISDAQIKAAADASDIITAEDDGIIITSKNIPDWMKELATVLCSYFGCAMWLTNYKEGDLAGISKMRASGLRADVELVKFFWKWLADKFRHLAYLHEQEVRVPGSKSDPVTRTSFLMGACAGLDSVLNSSKTTAIVRLNSERTRAAVDALKKMAEKVNQTMVADQAKFNVTDPIAFDKGYHAGRSHADLNAIRAKDATPDKPAS